MTLDADVVIIGGGIQGVSAAYYLSKVGIGKVHLVEMEDDVGLGTTQFSAGWFTLQASSEPNIRLSQISRNEFNSFKEMFNRDLHFNKVGSLSVTTEGFFEEMKEAEERYRLLSVPIKFLSENEIKQIVPFLHTIPGDIGLFCESDGLLDSNFLVRTYKEHAELLGATIETKAKVTGIEIENGKVTGVRLNNRQRIRTKNVINAAGLYCNRAAKMVGLKDFPTYRARRFTLITEEIANKKPELIPKTLIAIQEPMPIYLSWDGNSTSYSVGLKPEKSYKHKYRLEFNDYVYIDKHYGKRLEERIPDIYSLHFKIGTGGLRSVPKKQQESESHIVYRENRVPPQVGKSLPILGPIDGIKGYFNDCAWGGLGVSHAPAGGKIMAELLSEGKVSSIDITPFLLSRYSK